MLEASGSQPVRPTAKQYDPGMRQPLSLSLFLTLAVAGCGAQRGGFTSNGEDLRALSSHPECIDIV